MAFAVGDPLDAARTRAAVRARLFGGAPAPVRLGRLEIGARLGAGAMGVVYEARDPDLGRTVAVKVLRAGVDPDRLLGEARALARLRHPNVVAVFDVGVHDGHVYLVMERAAGRSLRERLEARPPWRAVVRLHVGVARGLAAAHAAGLVHRDVKPDNVLVDDRDDVRVVDFGLSIDEGTGGGAAGTPAYMAPEVLAGAPATAAADQYALGVMLRDAVPDAPGWLRRAVARMTSPDPARRFADVAAAARALDAGLARPARLAGGAGAVAVVAAAVGIGLAAGGDAGPDPCSGGPARLAGVWDDDRRAAVRAALAADGRGFAGDVAGGVVARLDRYADAWRTTHRASCLATRRGEQSARALDLRDRCLDRLRGALDATARRLAAATTDDLGRAIDAVAALPPVARCDDVASLEAATPLPDDPGARARIAGAEARLAAAQVDYRLGAWAAAEPVARELAAEAAALGWRPLEAEALLLLGQAEASLRRDGAEATLFRAVTAAQAGAAPAVLAEAQGHLALVVGRDAARLPDAERWLALAAATAERAGEPRLVAIAHDVRGRLRYAAGDLDAARAELARAVAAAEAAGADDPLLGRFLHNHGNVLDDAGATAEAKATLERALDVRARALGAGHPSLAETHNSLAIVLERLGDLDRAGDHYRRAAAIAADAWGERSPQRAQFLDYEAGVLRAQGRLDDALARRREALAILEAAAPRDDGAIAEIVSNLGVLHETRGELDLALAHHDRALALRRALYGDGEEVANSLGNLGDVHLALRRWDDALDHHRRGLALAEAALGADHRDLSWWLLGEAEAWIRAGAPAAARAPLTRALALIAADPAYADRRARALRLMAEVRRAAGDAAGAARDDADAEAIERTLTSGR